MEKKLLSDFSLEQLQEVKQFIETHKKIKTMRFEVDEMIKEKEQEKIDKENDRINGMNYRLTIDLMEKLHFFDSELLWILRNHDIKNIQDLIDSNLNTWGLTTQRRIELEEAKVWYDLSRIEREEKEKQNIKTKKKRKQLTNNE